MQHILQPAVLHHSSVAEDGGDAPYLKLTWEQEQKLEMLKE